MYSQSIRIEHSVVCRVINVKGKHTYKSEVKEYPTSVNNANPITRCD